MFIPSIALSSGSGASDWGSSSGSWRGSTIVWIYTSEDTRVGIVDARIVGSDSRSDWDGGGDWGWEGLRRIERDDRNTSERAEVLCGLKINRVIVGTEGAWDGVGCGGWSQDWWWTGSRNDLNSTSERAEDIRIGEVSRIGSGAAGSRWWLDGATCLWTRGFGRWWTASVWCRTWGASAWAATEDVRVVIVDAWVAAATSPGVWTTLAWCWLVVSICRWRWVRSWFVVGRIPIGNNWDGLATIKDVWIIVVNGWVWSSGTGSGDG